MEPWEEEVERLYHEEHQKKTDAENDLRKAEEALELLKSMKRAANDEETIAYVQGLVDYLREVENKKKTP